ncbi:MAG: ABC transporter substrate-binding protein [Bacteroidota bacterium]|nr:ABC transporter substrate-binding protein [Bacteroidota bacterium]
MPRTFSSSRPHARPGHHAHGGHFSWIIGLILCLGLGACQSEPETPNQHVEVFSWWTSGSEAAALEAIFEAFRTQYPNTDIINASIAGGGGSAARPVLQTRLVGGNPPDTWQTHHGAEVQTQYIGPGFTESLHDLYVEEGWYELFTPELLQTVSHDGVPHMVLINLHRSNILWYNKPLLIEHAVRVGETLSYDELFEIADHLQNSGVAALCMGDAGIWANGIMFENTLVGVMGPERYLGLWEGTTAFTDADIRQAITTYSRLLDYLNADHAALSWDQAVDKLLDGGCAFYSMGDWAYGELTQAGMIDHEDFGWVPHPGTENTNILVTDGFTLAKGAPNPEAARNMLRVMGQRAVQQEFNLLKGSICARSDCDRSAFSPYLQWAMDSYNTTVSIPTVVHGSAAPADFRQALNDALTDFVVRRDEEAFAATLAREAKASGFGQ